jgi:Rrf2 family protein
MSITIQFKIIYGGDKMKISTKGRYALRLMLDLAVNYTGEYISIKTIAARQGISEKYLEQIIAQLNRAGYVKSVRGAQGGYMLSKDPSEYTVGMILRLLEGSLAPVNCLEENNCERISRCVTMEVWEKIQRAIDEVVDNISLADLVARYHEKAEPIYII